MFRGVPEYREHRPVAAMIDGVVPPLARGNAAAIFIQ